MRFSSLSGADRGVGRNGRWFVLVFLCVALILAVLPAVSLGAASHAPRFSLKASAKTIVATKSVTLTASVKWCPANATITLKAITSRGMQTIGTQPAVVDAHGNASVSWKVKPTRDIGYEAVLTWPGNSLTSSDVWVSVKALLTLSVTPGTYGGAITISGTMIPSWPGGSVTVTIWKLTRSGYLDKVATLAVPLRASSGDMSTYATSWAAPTAGKYFFRTKVVAGPYFLGNTTRMIGVQL